MTSSSSTSGRNVLAASSASRPVAASATSISAWRRAVTSRYRMFSSSSTTRTRGERLSEALGGMGERLSSDRRCVQWTAPG